MNVQLSLFLELQMLIFLKRMRNWLPCTETAKESNATIILQLNGR